MASAAAAAGPSRLRPLRPLIEATCSARRIAKLPRRNVVEITGPDSKKFIKGLFCNDVQDATAGGYNGFLNASGRVIYTTFIIPDSSSPTPRYLITYDPPINPGSGSHNTDETHSPVQSLVKLLTPFKLRSKVKIKDVTDSWDVYASWGPHGNEGTDVEAVPRRIWKFGSGGAAEASWSWPDGFRSLDLGEGELGSWDLRAGFGFGTTGDGRGGDMARHILVPKGNEPSLSTSHEIVAEEEHDLRKMLLGIPEGGRVIHPGQSLPLESCMDVHAGVDFRKGCYLGQELTVRTYHTGATRKRILPISLFPLSPSPSTYTDSPTPLSDHITSPTDRPLPEEVTSISTLTETDQQTGKEDKDKDREIIYHPPPDAASKRSRPAGKILSLHPSSTHIGLGLVRLEYAERTWWSSDLGTLEDWNRGHRLTTMIGGKEWGVYVDQGEAFGAAMEALEEKVEAEEAGESDVD